MGLFKESVDLTSVIIGFIYCFLFSFLSFFWRGGGDIFLFKVKNQCAQENLQEVTSESAE